MTTTASAMLNALDEAAASTALAGCCAAPQWVAGMMQRRPFADDAALMNAVDEVAADLNEADWLAAFAAHPMIGDVDSLRKKYAATKQTSAAEQAGVDNAAEQTLAELARLNRDYRRRFGFIFIVCATGKSAAEMLALLRQRIGNSRLEELANATAEQVKITKLRLQKLATTKA